jgi:hypothetical protein
MTGPFERVPVHRRLPLARSAAVVALALFVVIVVLGAPLRTDAAPLGIVSLQVAASPDVAASILASWVDVPRARLLWAHGLDLALPVAYAVAIGLAAAGLSRGVGTSRAGVSAPAVAAGGALVAAIADQVENVAMWLTILRGPGWGSVLVTLVAMTVKSAVLVLALGALAMTYRDARNEVGRSVA